jgi:ELWxxDGT repeat protein
MYFTSSSSNNNYEPWVSDGTTTGTFLLKNINAQGSSNPDNFAGINNKVVFGALSSSTGDELYITTGTTSSTKLLKDIFKVDNTLSSNPAMLTSYNNRAYFFASTGDNSNKLWKTNGKSSGTELVYDFGTASKLDYGNMVVFKNLIYFTAASASTNDVKELWKSDGTVAGTVLVYSGFTGVASYAISDLTVVGNDLFFAADDGVHGKELWKSDGTTAGTMLVEDNFIDGISPQLFFGHNGTCYFTTTDGALWRSDGTASGTSLVIDVEPSNFTASPRDFTASPSNPNEFYFSAYTVESARELYKSDGTASGTTMVKEINPGTGTSDPHGLKAFNGMVYFFAADAVAGNSLWKTDGTSAGTVMVTDIYTTVLSGHTSELTPFSGSLYFSADDGINGYALWKTDGTTAGTVSAVDVNSNSPVSHLFVASGLLFFSASGPGTGEELYQTDGTQQGTLLIDDVEPGKGNFSPANLLFGNGSLLMTGTTEQYGNELYVYTPTLKSTNEEQLDAAISFDVYPNPAKSQVTIEMVLEHSTDAVVDVIDLSGRQLKIIYGGSLEAGTHQFELQRGDMTQGVYFIRLKKAESTCSKNNASIKIPSGKFLKN